MAFPTAINDQITDAVTQVYDSGGDDALTAVAGLITEIANALNGARSGETTIDDLADAFENAEVALHVIIADLATGRE
ncbi:MAG: hypothetical protein AB2728_04325 [Candidatus Thiodiazotropha sp.]|nr:hypothetical protein [Candidatus Thiodiazotropha taylori]MBT3058231.1 hypothetical protein [Candidatus Thiodiazotropha sp. (ex Lucina pensylvanica)]MBV2093440.1 hypothetical protein [Candidatus Thiodiazotropha sp. (ex Codakia orbicularis)]PUB72490.1 MAG: hypothetical protein DBP03_17080 [gamma proteobacterium symbiont of Ctena orbiculata]MBT3062777.1 hypothetical protein [Candidatus Thiodiazotropha sp. (ex Lucina pensylvanica)]